MVVILVMPPLRRQAFFFHFHTRLHAFILGHTGIMRQDYAGILQDLGILPSRVGPFLSRLAVAGLSLWPSCHASYL